MAGKQRSPFFGAVGLVTAGIGAGWIHYHYFDETRQKQLNAIRENIHYPSWQQVPSSSILKGTEWFCVASVNAPWYQKRLREVSFTLDGNQEDNDTLLGRWSATAFMYGGRRKGIQVETRLAEDSWRPFRSDKEVVDIGTRDSSGLPKWILLNDEKQPERLRVYAISPVLTKNEWTDLVQQVEKHGYEINKLRRMPQRS